MFASSLFGIDASPHGMRARRRSVLGGHTMRLRRLPRSIRRCPPISGVARCIAGQRAVRSSGSTARGGRSRLRRRRASTSIRASHQTIRRSRWPALTRSGTFIFGTCGGAGSGNSRSIQARTNRPSGRRTVNESCSCLSARAAPSISGGKRPTGPARLSGSRPAPIAKPPPASQRTGSWSFTKARQPWAATSCG